ncbi:unnamed protein product [Urochloa decumbens]|uniref:Uncharacterized protein n=1 Tax=Urochloa decumbens TaxID=240449 RepID=A0ABC9B0D3_9POAL
MASRASSPAVAAGGCSMSSITTATVTGSHVLRINGYSESRAFSVGSFCTSSMFMVGGHRWFLRYHPNGFNEETSDCISFFLVLSGSTSVRAEFMFSLLDPEGGQVHKKYTTCPVAFHGSRTIWGFPSFVKREDFEKSNYLQDNCFRIVCDITVVNGFYKDATMRFVDTVPPSDLHKDLGWPLSTRTGVDVKLKVRDKLFLAHKNVLAARSRVFFAMLFGPLKKEATDLVEIHDMEPEVFKAMLDFIYTDSVPAGVVTGEEIAMAQHLLVAADRYDLRRLKLICEDKLCSRVTKKTAAIVLVLAEQHGCHGLKKACFAFLSSLGSLKAVMDTEGYDHLRSSCPSLHDELVAKFDIPKRNKTRSFWCFSVQ